MTNVAYTPYTFGALIGYGAFYFGSSYGTASTQTLPQVPDPTATRAVIIALTEGSSVPYVTAVTAFGFAATKVDSYPASPGQANASIWEVSFAAGTSGNVVITLDEAAPWQGGFVVLYYRDDPEVTETEAIKSASEFFSPSGVPRVGMIFSEGNVPVFDGGAKVITSWLNTSYNQRWTLFEVNPGGTPRVTVPLFETESNIFGMVGHLLGQQQYWP